MPTRPQIFLYFLKLGATGFGGPLALIALMERDLVKTKKWISPTEFKDALLYCKLLPGPVAYQMALWMGRVVGGKLGGFLAGMGILLPSAILLTVLANFYSQLETVPLWSALMKGLTLAALAIILESSYRLIRPLLKDRFSTIFFFLAFVLFFLFPRWEPVIILVGGFAALFTSKAQSSSLKVLSFPILWKLFWTHFKAGSVVFGAGFAILPVLERDIVGAEHWLTTREFLDAVAFGQMTPGPITITSVFVGTRVAGPLGGFAAFLGMYLPGILLVLWLVPLLKERLEKNLLQFQKGAFPMVMGCLAGGAVFFLRTTLVPDLSAVVFVGLLALQFFLKPPSIGLLLLGAIFGLVIS